jgi:Gnt-I system low-affinity gluconate transporter
LYSAAGRTGSCSQFYSPHTPGPIAVAQIIGARLGWVIPLGLLLGIPTAIIAGPVFDKYIAGKINIKPPEELPDRNGEQDSKGLLPSFWLIIILIVTPLILIVLSTITDTLVSNNSIQESTVTNILVFIGHPFSALIIATLMTIWLLGIKRGMSREKIMTLSTKALGPAGIIILVKGAGGVLKEVLVESGISAMAANSVAGAHLSPILLAWILATIISVTQGSATVAMITAAGIIAPVVPVLALDESHKALIVIAIASGATMLSYVNGSGFCLVNKYFGMDEKQTLQSWKVMETIIALCGLTLTLTANHLR